MFSKTHIDSVCGTSWRASWQISATIRLADLMVWGLLKPFVKGSLWASLLKERKFIANLPSLGCLPRERNRVRHFDTFWFRISELQKFSFSDLKPAYGHVLRAQVDSIRCYFLWTLLPQNRRSSSSTEQGRFYICARFFICNFYDASVVPFENRLTGLPLKQFVFSMMHR